MSSQPLSFRHDILGAPDSAASPKDSALIIIDAQNEYALGKLKVSNVASSRKAITSLLKKYRENGGTNFSFIHFRYQFLTPALISFDENTETDSHYFLGKIVHVRHQTPEGAPVFTPGTELATEFDELKPKDGEAVIWKKFPGSFAQTELQKELGDNKKVVLTGYTVCCAAVFPASDHSKSHFCLISRNSYRVTIWLDQRPRDLVLVRLMYVFRLQREKHISWVTRLCCHGMPLGIVIFPEQVVRRLRRLVYQELNILLRKAELI